MKKLHFEMNWKDLSHVNIKRKKRVINNNNYYYYFKFIFLGKFFKMSTKITSLKMHQQN